MDRRWRQVAGGVLALAFVVAPAAAHEGHQQRSAAAEIAAAPADSAGEAAPAAAGEVEAFAMPPLAEALGDHPHNRVVHFPIALSLTALALMLLARRRPGWAAAARALVVVAAAGAVAAFFTGRAQEEAFAGEPKEWVVELHEKLGIAAAVGLVVWAIAAYAPRTRRWAPWLGVVASGLTVAASFYGGLAAHG